MMRALLVVAVLLALAMPVSAQTIPVVPLGPVAAVSVSPGLVRVGQRLTAVVGLTVGDWQPVGSYTASLRWDPRVLKYRSSWGVPAGFMCVVNPAGAAGGRLVFNGASAGGATGRLTLLTVVFDAVGPGVAILDLDFSAMAAARSFVDLLPVLSITDGRVVVAPWPWRRW